MLSTWNFPFTDRFSENFALRINSQEINPLDIPDKIDQFRFKLQAKKLRLTDTREY
jgi:hypothetical protein